MALSRRKSLMRRTSSCWDCKANGREPLVPCRFYASSRSKNAVVRLLAQSLFAGRRGRRPLRTDHRFLVGAHHDAPAIRVRCGSAGGRKGEAKRRPPLRRETDAVRIRPGWAQGLDRRALCGTSRTPSPTAEDARSRLARPALGQGRAGACA